MSRVVEDSKTHSRGLMGEGGVGKMSTKILRTFSLDIKIDKRRIVSVSQQRSIGQIQIW